MSSRIRCLPIFALLLLALFPAMKAATPAAAKSEVPAAARPWDGAPFSAKAEEIRKAVDFLPASGDFGSQVLLEDVLVRFENDGSCLVRTHRLIHILKQEGVSDWDKVKAVWQPWCTDRPVIQARVVTSEGKEYTLDPATIVEGSPKAELSGVMSEERNFQAPLPAIRQGSIVETLVTKLFREPIPGMGCFIRALAGFDVPVLCTRIVLDRPSGMDIRTFRRNLDGAAQTEDSRSARIISTYVFGELKPWEKSLSYAPPEHNPQSEVMFGLPRTWQQVAAAYAKLVKEKIDRSEIPDGLLPAGLSPKDRDGCVRAALSYLLKHIRSTGIEFGAASLMPASPAEVLQRQYGDSKDKATLLVAMLKKLGIPARMALLSTRGSADQEPEIPACSGFTLAVVYIPGPTPLWVDPTAEQCPVGTLPPLAQGRWALVVDPETKSLVRTPEFGEDVSLETEKREFFLGEKGPARIVETKSFQGVCEQLTRQSYTSGKAQDHKKWLEEYAQSEYLAKVPVTGTYGDPNDLSHPFEIRIEIPKGNRGYSASDGATAFISVDTVFRGIPKILRPLSSTSEQRVDKKEEDRKDPLEGRKQDLYFFVPYTRRLEIHIVPAPGFEAATLPDSEIRQFGSFRMTTEFVKESDGSVTAKFSTSTPRRVSPADALSLRDYLGSLKDRRGWMVPFNQKGEVLLANGKIQEAMAEFRALEKLHPTEALHRCQMARTLLAAGIAGAARREAKDAVRLEPDSALAHKTHGWVLVHGLLGRQLEDDFDYKGAVAAYRKALELNPEEEDAREELAALLTFDSKGDRYTPAAPLTEAAAEYALLRNGSDVMARSHDRVLLHLGRYAEVLDFPDTARKDEEAEQERKVARIVARTLRENPSAGLAEAERLWSDVELRRKALLEAADLCEELRKYSQAVNLFREAMAGSSKASEILAHAELLKDLHRNEELPPASDSPVGIVQRFYRCLLADEIDMKEMNSVLVPQAYGKEGDTILLRDLGALRKILLGMVGSRDNRRLALLDLLLGSAKFTSNGSDTTGYKIVQIAHGADHDSQILFFVIPDKGYRILAVLGSAYPTPQYIQRLVAAGREKIVRSYLDWYRELLPSGNEDDALSGASLRRVWKKGVENPSINLEVAIAILEETMNNAERCRESLPGIAALLERKDLDSDLRLRLRVCQCNTAFATEDFTLGETAARQLWKENPGSEVAFNFLTGILAKQKKWDEALAVCRERMVRLPEDVHVRMAAAQLQAELGHYEEAIRILKEAMSSGDRDHESGLINNLAWYSLLLGKVDPEILQEAQKACQASEFEDAGIIHTLAAISAEMGNVAEAKALLMKYLELDESPASRPGAWLVAGRIAEQFGEREAALEAYERVRNETENESQNLISSWFLAKRRVQILDPSRKF